MQSKNVLLSFVLLASCTNAGSTNASSEPTGLTLSASAKGWSGLCQALAVSLKNASGSPAVATSSVSINLATDVGSLFSNPECSSSVSSVVITQGSQSVTAYYKSTSLAVANVTADGASLGSAAAQISIEQPVANLVLGQPNFTSGVENNGGVSGSTMSWPYNPLRIGNRLIVADAGNNRVLIWNNVPASSSQTPDLVLGQPNLTVNTCNTGGASAQTLCNPSYVFSDGTRLLVADGANNRVLIWNSMPTQNQQAADLVLGQPNFNSVVANNGGLSAATLSFPEFVSILDSKLYVSDVQNNRVLIWNSFPTTHQQAANVVLGQTNMTSNAPAVTASGLSSPYMIATHGGKLYVCDDANNRVLVWNTIPTASGAPADFALGQPNLTSSTANNGGVSATSLSGPAELKFDNQGRFYVEDYFNSRVLIWNRAPSAGEGANAVVGQPDFVTNTANNGGITARSLNLPWGMDVYGNELWVSDYTNHRVLRYAIP